MRLYNDNLLRSKTKIELNNLLETVKRNDGELSKIEQETNIKNIEMFLNGGTIEAAIVADMVAGQADIDDIGGMN